MIYTGTTSEDVKKWKGAGIRWQQFERGVLYWSRAAGVTTEQPAVPTPPPPSPGPVYLRRRGHRGNRAKSGIAPQIVKLANGMLRCELYGNCSFQNVRNPYACFQ